MFIFKNGTQNEVKIQNGNCEVNYYFWGRPCEEGAGISHLIYFQKNRHFLPLT